MIRIIFKRAARRVASPFKEAAWHFRDYRDHNWPYHKKNLKAGVLRLARRHKPVRTAVIAGIVAKKALTEGLAFVGQQANDWLPIRGAIRRPGRTASRLEKR
jgi:hypothetical protein